MKGIFLRLENFVGKYSKVTLLLLSFLFAFITVTFSNGLSSFIYPSFRQDFLVQDPQFFYLSASLMLKGQTMYVDIFDHKGLYIFWFHALGQLLGGRIGLYFLEFIWFSCIFYFLGLIYKEMGANLKWTIFLHIAFAAAFIVQQQGASDEEVELPFLVMATYFYVRGYVRKSERDFMWGNILWGVMAGVCLNLRPSDCMFALGPILAYAITMLRHKRWLPVLRDAGLCVAALLLTSAPAYIAAYCGGYLEEMWESVIVSNFSYVSSTQNASSFKYVCMALVGAFILACIPAFCFLYRKIDREEWIFYVASLAFVGPLQLWFALYTHYWIMAYPYIFMLILRLLQNIQAEKAKKIVLPGTAILSSIALLATSIAYPTAYYATQYPLDQEAEAYILENISQSERENHTICIDCECGTYNATGIIPHFKDFAMQGWHSTMDDTLKDRLEEYLNSGYVHYVVLEDDDWTGREYRAPIRALVTEGPFELLDEESTCRSLDVYRYTGTWLYTATA